MARVCRHEDEGAQWDEMEGPRVDRFERDEGGETEEPTFRDNVMST